MAGNRIIFNESGTTSELFSPAPAQGEPVTPPPNSGYGDPVVVGASLGEDDQGFWLPADMSNEPVQNSPEYVQQPARYTMKGEAPLPLPNAVASVREFPKQLPWIVEYPYEAIWRNDHSSVTNGRPWPGQPFF